MIGIKDEIINHGEVLNQFILPRELWTPIDEMLYGTEDFFNILEHEVERLRFEAIKYAFNYQYSKNAFYRNFCEGEGITPDDIKETADFIKIPKIPDTFFKDYPSSKPREFYSWLRKTSAVDIGKFDFNEKASLDEMLDQIELKTRGIALHSSGTSGKFSIIVRDEIGRNRWGYILAKVGLFSIVQPSRDAHVIYLGPSQTHLAFGRLMAGLNRVFETSHIHYLIDRKVTMDILSVAMGIRKGLRESVLLYLMRRASDKARAKMIELLQKLNEARKQVFIISTPYEVYRIITQLKRQEIRLNFGETNSVVLTAAGWKTFENERISAEKLRETVAETLQIPEERCRDMYGMSEWHGLAWECEGHYKHIIQCTYPMVLDENLELLGYGEYGRYAFLDPMSNTFPGFIITGDKVKMLPRCPVCNRTSPVLEPEITRMPGAESRGCTGLMRTLVGEELAEITK